AGGRRAAGAAAGPGPGRLPRRPGGPDQRAQARRKAGDHRPARVRGSRVGGRGRRRRAADTRRGARAERRARVGAWPARLARADRAVRRRTGRRAPAGRWLAGPRPAAGGPGGQRPRGGAACRGPRVPGGGAAVTGEAGAPATREGAVPRVVIADDQTLVRGGFRMILGASGITVVAEAADGAQAVAAVLKYRPDVVLMDIRMPEMDGLEATRRILAAPAGRDCRIIILTTFDLDQYVYAALTAGASGFLLKDVTPEQLVAAVRMVRSGDALLAPSITRRLVERFAPRAP